ncbi:aspartate aminotransferase family protein [Alicyclobacillus sp. SO9]|uniref:aspartate aminotransferase family protein n=1 Tax=Alicyclobacillus sp. SO9 TaxID=2665646 RepID=UPI0018E6EEE1|nr:aspartate aminotransferase family protein [Alicyclobacillus sp. SO9]QQE79771.1 aspartate aminotransferase family protein [Alicyclobacillus sp. SO9]
MSEQTYLIKPNLNQTYPVVSHGKGIYLFDTSGKKYLDGSSGAITSAIGHGVEQVLNDMMVQGNKVCFVHRGHFTNQPAEELAEALAKLAPGHLNQTFFVNSGSEATETAMKLAVQYWQERGCGSKNRIISRWISYHGITNGALSMSGHVIRRKRFASLLQDLPVISPPYLYRSLYQGDSSEVAERYAKELETAIERAGSENVAAFIAEPVIGAAGGVIIPPDGYFQRIREICDRYDILLIADEVMTGLGRTGKMFAMEHWGVVADIMTLGKGMSAGYSPIAAAVVSDSIVDTIRSNSGSIMGGHTYSANPLSCAAALSVVRYVEENDLVSNANEQGEYLLQGLNEIKVQSKWVGDVRGIGLMCGIEFVRDKKTKEPFTLDSHLTDKMLQACFNNGLIAYPATGAINGSAGDAMMIAPPLTISRSEVDELVDILQKSIAEVEQHL